MIALLAGLALQTAAGQGFANDNYTSDLEWQLISPDLSDRHFNQPIAVSGYVLLGGNAIHELWDVSDPFAPAHVSTLTSPFHDGEAESHQISVRVLADGTVMVATISGFGVDLWDITDPARPELLAAVELDGIAYGDNTSAVWGLAWQGDALYVGGTNTGLHILDTTDPRNPVLVDRIPTLEFGGVSAGPLYAIGNLLVITPPKDHKGIATLDIGDPWDPAVLDFDIPARDTYIGAYYAGMAYHLDPLRTWDVTSDPADIRLIAEHETFDSEYVSFGDGFAFVGALRPNPGIHKLDLSDPSVLDEVGKVVGRTDVGDGLLNDDQFSVPIANLLVVCDDQIRKGCVLGVHDIQPDFTAPEIATVNPPDGAANQPVTTRIGLSLTDQVDTRSLDADSVQLRPLTGGPPVAGSWGVTQTEVAFWPDAPLEPDTTYEIFVPAGGLTDLAGNPVAEHSSLFSTGADVARLHCGIETEPVEVHTTGALTARAVDGVTYTWDFGDGGTDSGQIVAHRWSAHGRYVVQLTVSDGVNQRTCAAVQVVHRPLRDWGPHHASTVAVYEGNGRVWTVNPDNDTVTALDASTLDVLFEVPVGDHPRTLSANWEGVWVANQGSDTIALLDHDSGEVIREVELPWGSAPYGVVADSGGVVWATLEQRGALVRIEGPKVETFHLGEGVPGPQVRGLALDPDGAVWVSRFLSPPDGAELYRWYRGGVETFTLRVDPGPDGNDQGRGVPNYLSSLTVSPDDERLVVPSKKDNVERGIFLDGEPLDSDNTVRTVLSFVKPGSGEEAESERLDLDDRDRLTAAVYSPLGDLLFAASQGSNQVDVMDAYTGRRVGGFGTGLAPDGLVIDRATRRLFVSNFLDRSLSVFDVSGLLDGTDATAWLVDTVPVVSSEVLEPEVLLGKQIFYNANTKAMSSAGYLSCATCHLDGGHDGQTWDFTDRGEGLRNTIDLRGKAGTGHGPVHWTANFDEIQDFENDIRHAFGGSGLMSDDDFLLTEDTLGEPKAGYSEQLDALAAYVESLDTFPRSPFRAADGELSIDATIGQRIVERRCMECHAGRTLTDSEGTRGLHDVGTIKKSSGQRLGGELTGIDTPTLLGLWATAPYLHDGSAATLPEVLENVDHVGRLSDPEKVRVVTFLLELEERDLPLQRRGCGCATGRGAAGWLWLGLPLVVWLRRRQSQFETM